MTAHPSDHDIQRDTISGARILVGDMLTWSDLDSLSVPLAAREIARSTIGSTRPQRILLAGPRAALLVDTVPTDVPVDLLVRSLPDARLLSGHTGLHRGAELYCGGLDAFAPGHRYDLIVALGGPARLLGPDSRGLTEEQTVARLAELLEDGGRMMLDLANGMGFTDLVSALPDDAIESDAGWHVGAAGFSPRHLFSHERDAVLQSEGLHVEAVFAAIPSVDDHRLLVDTAAATEGRFGDQISELAGRAMDEHFATTPVLRETRPLVQRLVDARLLDELAPAWLVIATKGAAGVDGPAYPAIVTTEPVVDQPWSVVSTISADGAQTLSWADSLEDAERSEGTVSRKLIPAAAGRSFELELRLACATRRHASIRSHVRRYAAWLADDGAWTTESAGERLFATPANTVVEGAVLHLADASWRWTGDITGHDALVRGLRDFSRRLLASGSPHPWRVTITPDELTVTLAAMAGHTVTPHTISRVARIEAEVAATVAGRPGEAELLLHRNLEQGRFGRDLPAPDEAGYRELLTDHRVISRALREMQGQVAWLEGTLRHRDRYIRTLEKVIERFEETMTYRAVEAIRAPRRIATRKAVAAAKSTARDALPPGALAKARQVATRVLK